VINGLFSIFIGPHFSSFPFFVTNYLWHLLKSSYLQIYRINVIWFKKTIAYSSEVKKIICSKSFGISKSTLTLVFQVKNLANNTVDGTFDYDYTQGGHFPTEGHDNGLLEGLVTEIQNKIIGDFNFKFFGFNNRFKINGNVGALINEKSVVEEEIKCLEL